MGASQSARVYRFGVFEADAATGELRRQGVRIKLNAQPFQVLLMLLERPGHLLTREEISRHLWPDGTVVDYEHGVNSAVNRIREALGDTAGNPRFVETLARRGYRFVAPVEPMLAAEVLTTQPASTADLSSMSPAELVAFLEKDPPTRGRILATPDDLPKSSPRLVQTLFLLLQLMYVAFYVGALANLPEIEDLLAVMPRANIALGVVMVTAAILIPVRAFVLCAVLFRAPRFRGKFLKMWPFLVPFDQLWSLSPFLLLHHISFGLALSCSALLVYAPFAQRSLVLMGAAGHESEEPANAH
jgi:DNA-binding winged helix-turn-helix (wHTH) protein